MHLLIFHGYLLRGTGSNVYNARLVPALVRAGHTVDLLAQDSQADELGWVDAIGSLAPGGAVTGVDVLRAPIGVTVWQPDIDGLLPVYAKGTRASTCSPSRGHSSSQRTPPRSSSSSASERHELAPLLAVCTGQVVPSTFPEAFGMVAAKAAAAGVLTIVAAHSELRRKDAMTSWADRSRLSCPREIGERQVARRCSTAR